METEFKKIDPQKVKEITKEDEDIFMRIGSLPAPAQEYLLLLTKRINELENTINQLKNG